MEIGFEPFFNVPLVFSMLQLFGFFTVNQKNPVEVAVFDRAQKGFFFKA